MKLTIENYDGEQMTCLAKWEICDRCKGNGRHETYLCCYDVQCEECKGTGKVLVPDLEYGGGAARIVAEFLRQRRMGP